MWTAFIATQLVLAVTGTNEEFAAAKQWTDATFGKVGAAPVAPPFSFNYGEQPSSALLPAWTLQSTNPSTDVARRTTEIVWRSPDGVLECRYVCTEFLDSPAVEWVVYFKNTGTTDSAILDDIQALDAGVPLPRANAARVHFAKGSECRVDDFAPLVATLGPSVDDPQGGWVGQGNPVRIETRGGRSSCGVLPFFNVDMNDHGVIGAVGWTGDWAANFYRTDTDVRMRAGMKRTHFKLLPGEEVRSPRIALVFWQGSVARGQNLLRQFILAHHTPMQDGKPAQAPIAHATWGGNFADKHIAHGQWWKDQGLPMEYLWVDAGWFGQDEAKEGATVFNSQWARFVGDWHANPGYFPGGLNPVGAALNDMGLKLLLWLEPERVFKDTPWTKEHPEWLMGPQGDNYFYNLGIPEARAALSDFLSTLIAEGKIGCYRQDFNMDPRPFWDAADASDRIGISEIKHITGLYALWDDLLARNPGLLIDNCSSGGRRIDLESISRSMPLWRSDLQCWPNFNATIMQTQTQGLGQWVPLSIGCFDREDTYAFRSALGPGMIALMYDFEKDVTKHPSIDWMKARFDELNAVRPYFTGDLWPLTSFSMSDDAWAAWQIDRPDLGEGCIVALRRPASPFGSMTPKLNNLDATATYEVRDVDTAAMRHVTGNELCELGIPIGIDSAPGSKLLMYKKLPKP